MGQALRIALTGLNSVVADEDIKRLIVLDNRSRIVPRSGAGRGRVGKRSIG